MDTFNKQSVKELQAHLKAGDEIKASYLKAGLVELCIIVHVELGRHWFR